MSQTARVKAGNGLGVFAAALLLASCLSETLIDNYDARAIENTGHGGMPTGTSLVFPPVTSDGQPSGAFSPGVPTLSVASGGVRGTSGGSTIGAGGTSSAVVVGNAGQVGSLEIRQADHQARHHLERYVSFPVADGSLSDIALGITGSDHLVAQLSLSNIGPTLGGLGPAGVVPGLLEVLPSGDSLRYVVFPLGITPDSFAVDPAGAVVMAGRLDHDVSYGGSTLARLEHGYYVVKLDADWNPLFEVVVETEGDVAPSEVVIDADGRIHLAMVETRLDGQGSVAVVAGFDAWGTQIYRWPIGSGEGIQIDGLVVNGDDALLLAGRFDTVFSAGPLVAENVGASDGWFGSWKLSNGEPTAVRQFGSAGNDRAAGIGWRLDGGIRVVSVSGGESSLFGVPSKLPPRGAPFLVDLDDSGAAVSVIQLAGEGTVDDYVQVGERSYVTGTFYGTGGASVVNRSRLYAAEIERDGTVLSFWSIESSGTGASHVAVDSRGTIWLSGRASIVPSSGGDTPVDSYVLLQLVRDVQP